MSSFPGIIQNSLSLLESNLNSGFSNQLSNLLKQQGINSDQLWKPLVDMVETTDEVIIFAGIAGVKKDSVDVDFFNNFMHIRGERAPLELEDEIITRHKKEIIYGQFERKITLPISITNRDSVAISMLNGVLIIKLNKTVERLNRFSVRLPTIPEN